MNSEVETTNIFKLRDDGGLVDLMIHQIKGNIAIRCLKAEARGLGNLFLKMGLSSKNIYQNLQNFIDTGTSKSIKIEAIISF